MKKFPECKDLIILISRKWRKMSQKVSSAAFSGLSLKVLPKFCSRRHFHILLLLKKLDMMFHISLPATGNFCHLLICFENSLDPVQARQNVGPDLDANCLSP